MVSFFKRASTFLDSRSIAFPSFSSSLSLISCSGVGPGVVGTAVVTFGVGLGGTGAAATLAREERSGVGGGRSLEEREKLGAANLNGLGLVSSFEGLASAFSVVVGIVGTPMIAAVVGLVAGWKMKPPPPPGFKK